MLDMANLLNGTSINEASSRLSAAIVAQLEKIVADDKSYETVLFRAAALLIQTQGKLFLCLYCGHFLLS